MCASCCHHETVSSMHFFFNPHLYIILSQSVHCRPQVCFYVDKAKVILHYSPIINIPRLDKIMPHHNTALAFALFLYPPSSFIILKYKQLIIINYLWLVFIQNPFIISPHLSQYYILGQLILHAEQHYRNPCCTSERSEGRKKRSGKEWFWIIRAVSEIKKHTVRNSKGERGNGEVGGDEGLALCVSLCWWWKKLQMH